jgi:hypothetical protein
MGIVVAPCRPSGVSEIITRLTRIARRIDSTNIVGTAALRGDGPRAEELMVLRADIKGFAGPYRRRSAARELRRAVSAYRRLMQANLDPATR